MGRCAVKNRELVSTEQVLRWSGRGKRIIAGILMALMFLVVGLVTAEIVVAFFAGVVMGETTRPSWLISEAELFAVLGLFLSVLIALELIETVEVYFKKHSIHVEIVVLVAIIALARKVILLDTSKYGASVILALAALIVALGATYFMVRKAAPPEEHQ
jgi:uncharacterized membrane protein (DUF373 family)